MHITRSSRSIRPCMDNAPPGMPKGASGYSIGSTGRHLLHLNSHRLYATKRTGTASNPDQDSNRLANGSWGVALASKARKGNGLRRQYQQQQELTLETVEAVSVSTDGATVGYRGTAGASGSPVIVVQPQEPSPQPWPAQPSSSASVSNSRVSTGMKSGNAGNQAPPAVSFVRPPGPTGRSSSNRPTPSRRAMPVAIPNSGTSYRNSSSSKDSSQKFNSSDAFTNSRGLGSSGAVPAWLLAAANKKANSVSKVAGGRAAAAGSAPAPPSTAASSSSGSSSFHGVKPTPTTATTSTAAAAAATTAGTVAAAAAAAAARAGASGRKADQHGDLPLSVSFSQIMGRQKQSKSDSQTQIPGQTSDAAENDVMVDYTWEPDPDLDVVEADAAVEAEAKRQGQEKQRDYMRVRQELREAAEAAVLRSYAPGTPLPPAFVGSVRAERISGRGFGLVADEDVAAGQLLLVSLPAVCERGPAGEPPQMRPLLAEVLRLLRLADSVTNASAGDAAEEPGGAAAADGCALASLYWGAPRPSSSRPPPDLVAWRSQQQQLLSKDGAGSTGTPAGAGAASGGPVGSLGRGAGNVVWTQPRVMSLLQLNLMAEGSQDGAATVARSEPLTSMAGIWPEVALINHSCAPNAVAVLLQDRLVVRATRRIPQGREVLINWLGGSAGVLAPCQTRREQISQMYTFACRCARCQLESAEAVSLPFLYADAERESEQALELIEEALQIRDLGSLTLALRPLQAAVTQLASAIQLLGEQVDLTGGREGMMVAATMGMPGMAEEEDQEGAGGGILGAASASAQRMMATSGKKKGSGGSMRANGEGKGHGGGSASRRQRAATSELGPINRAMAEAWLIGGMLPLHEALMKALAYLAAWLGMDLGPGWHWPPEQPVAVPASAAGRDKGVASDPATAAGAGLLVMDDDALEEQQAEAVAELIGSLASYVDIVGQLLPGSELHTQAAARLLSLSRRFLGPMDRVAGDISTAVYDAYVLRYGKLDEETFERLLTAGMEALDAALRLDAARQGGRALDSSEGKEADEAAGGRSDLDTLFLEDQRLREEHAAAVTAAARKAAAAAAVQPPRSWPLRGGQAGGGSMPVSTIAPMKVRSKAAKQAALEEVEDEEEDHSGLGLPEDVAVRSARSGGVGSRRRSVMEEAEQDLLTVLGSSTRPRPTSVKRNKAGLTSRPAAWVVEEGAEGDDVAASVQHLFRRDATAGAAPGFCDGDDGDDGPGSGGGGGGGDHDDEGDDGLKAEEAKLGGGEQHAARGGKRISPQQKFESSLDALLNVFPSLGSSLQNDGSDNTGASQRLRR